MNLIPTNILFTSTSEMLKSGAITSATASIADTFGAEWKLTLLDTGKTVGVTTGDKVVKSVDGVVIVPYTYTDSAVSATEKVNQISVMITDKEYTDGEAQILYYGALQDIKDSDGNASEVANAIAGTGTFELPGELEEKILGTDYYIYILAECVNDVYRTDYAGTPTAITEIYDEIGDVSIEIDVPQSEVALDVEASITGNGVLETNANIVWTKGGSQVNGNADYYSIYTASMQLSADSGYVFTASTVAKVNGNVANITMNNDETITISYTFPSTSMENISYTATGYEGTYDGNEHSIEIEITSPLDTEITYSVDGITYSETKPQFSEKGNYVVYYKIEKDTYATATGSREVVINAATVTVTADAQVIKAGTSIDNSKYTTTDLVAGDVISQITLTPSTTEVTENGSITASNVKIVNASGKDVTGSYDIAYVPGTLVIELNIINASITGYTGTYDGMAHGIVVEVSDIEDVTITYSTDGITYSETNPQFINKGSYRVYYKIEKENYATVTGNKDVVIDVATVTVTADNQVITVGGNIDDSKYTISGLVEGDVISQITLTPSTAEVTANGTITASDVKILNAEAEDVTGNYNIAYVQGKLVIELKTIDCTISGYNGTYDGTAHGIVVDVSDIEDVTITYSTDGITYSDSNPKFINKGSYTVYYKLEKENYATITGSKEVVINVATVTITADNQTIIAKDNIDDSKYTHTGLVTGDVLSEIKITPSTTKVTDNGTITLSNAKILNANGDDVTGNYDIKYVAGKLVIEVKEVVDYDITEGENQEWIMSSDESITISGNGEYDKFVGIKINDEFIDEDAYTVDSESGAIVIKNVYLSALLSGKYEIKMIWIDGVASTTFTVVKEQNLEDETEEDTTEQETEVETEVETEDDTEVETETETETKTEEETGGNVVPPDTGDAFSYGWLIALIVGGLIAVMISIRKNNYIENR